MKIVLCIPTFNSEKKLGPVLEMIQKQTLRPDELWAIDSSSKDKTVSVLTEAGFKVQVIPQKEFNHGATRNLFFKLAQGDIYIFLTDDAIPHDNQVFEKIIAPFLNDPEIGMAYGRQIPHPGATPFAAHARFFNYENFSLKKTMKDAPTLGIKTPFCSNSFSAYRKKAWDEIGGFPDHTILSEDTFAAARMLQRGWGLHYTAEAVVSHSHNYSIIQEFKRYFDIGVFYGREKWIKETFGLADGEGKKFVFSELAYLKKNKKSYLIPQWFFRNAMKLIGYKMGFFEKNIPVFLKKKISMHHHYWG